MIAVIQRVSEAKVEISEKTVGQIQFGALVLLGIENDDNDEDIEWLSRKIVNLIINIIFLAKGYNFPNASGFFFINLKDY